MFSTEMCDFDFYKNTASIKKREYEMELALTNRDETNS